MENINISEVILSSSDWSVETILDRFASEHIQINPNSWRRHAWDLVVKSRFIESIILGFPIPQILLAADLKERGKYAVVDGNQRLLSILEFYGETETGNNGFVLTGLEFRTDLNRSYLARSPILYQSYLLWCCLQLGVCDGSSSSNENVRSFRQRSRDRV